jgi:hypothetical protein
VEFFVWLLVVSSMCNAWNRVDYYFYILLAWSQFVIGSDLFWLLLHWTIGKMLKITCSKKDAENNYTSDSRTMQHVLAWFWKIAIINTGPFTYFCLSRIEYTFFFPLIVCCTLYRCHSLLTSLKCALFPFFPRTQYLIWIFLNVALFINFLLFFFLIG